MPQLDSATFISQFFWVTLFFLGFYIYFVRNILPTLGSLLKMRQKKIIFAQKELESLEKDQQTIYNKYNNVFLVSFDLVKDFLNNSKQSCDLNSENEISDVKTQIFSKVNQNFISRMINYYVDEKTSSF